MEKQERAQISAIIDSIDKKIDYQVIENLNIQCLNLLEKNVNNFEYNEIINYLNEVADRINDKVKVLLNEELDNTQLLNIDNLLSFALEYSNNHKVTIINNIIDIKQIRLSRYHNENNKKLMEKEISELKKELIKYKESLN